MRILFALLVLCLPAFGQAGNVKLRIVVFPRSSDDAPLELIAGEKVIPIEVASNRLTGPYEVPRQAKWVFGNRTTDEEGKPSFNVLGSGKSIQDPNQIIALFRKGPNNDDGFNVIAYPGGKRNFGGRQFLVLNLTNQTIGGELGTKKFGLKKGAHTVVSPKSIPGKDLCHASILLKEADRWRPLVTTNWPLRDDARGLIIIYSDPKRKKIRLHSIRDFL